MSTPEAKARAEIDRLLLAAGWHVQDRKDLNIHAGLGVAVRELPAGGGEANYLLYVDRKLAGVLEAKKAGVPLSGVEEQGEKYATGIAQGLPVWGSPLPFSYESTGIETYFRDRRDPKPRSRRLFAFHKPETLLEWLQQPTTLRARLKTFPSLSPEGLRDCQVEAVRGLERSLAGDRPRALIQMATGAGKTYTACNFAYRLIKHGGAKRVLFLVDRTNLGTQAFNEFQQFKPPDDGRAFTQLYNVQQLSSNVLDADAKVVITTIQRVFSMLSGEPELPPEAEELSIFETREDQPEREVAYNAALPIETFDFIVVDECHRSIYKTWRQVLEYFDAFLIGLTATPSAQTLGFFKKNLVSEYPYERSVVDGVNVGYEIYRIKTAVSERGGKIEAGHQVGIRDKRTRKLRWQEMDQELPYAARDLDRSVVVPDQIRTILKTYRDKLSTELFPGRKWAPKTLIFAKDDNHAEEIVRISREVFEEGDDFCRKITYRTSGESPAELLKRFRVNPYPRIAVTVDMIATGTDVRPLEVLIFLRDVKSSLYYEQMKGRGARIISKTDLNAVTPDAPAKTHFVLIDAVGVTESVKSDHQPMDRKPGVGFATLLERVAMGRSDDETLSSLAARLARLEREVKPDDQVALRALAGGKTLGELAGALLDSIDPDVLTARALEQFGDAGKDSVAKTAKALKEAATRPFSDPQLRRLLADAKTRAEQFIHESQQDEVTYAGFDMEKAQQIVGRFKEFIAENRDRIEALSIIYAQPRGKGHLTYDMIRELADALQRPPLHLTTDMLWLAYQRLEQARVRKVKDPGRLLTNIVQLVRYAIGLDQKLEPFDQEVERRFNLWVGRQMKAGKSFTDEQMNWLKRIRDHIAENVTVERRDLMDLPHFAERGGLVKARSVFGSNLPALLDELNGSLVA